MEEGLRLQIEIHCIQGILRGLRGNKKDLLESYQFQEGNWEIESLRRHILDSRETLTKRIEALDNPVANLPWPDLGVKVWTPFQHDSLKEPCPSCKGEAVISVKGATYKCVECQGGGTHNITRVVPVQATVVKVVYVRSGSKDWGWGEITPELFHENMIIMMKDEEDTNWIAEGSFSIHRSEEECQREIDLRLNKGWNREFWPRWRRHN